MAYYPSSTHLYRCSASYTDKILKGANPADLPVGQPQKIDLLINLKAAPQIGLTIPQSVLYRADKFLQFLSTLLFLPGLEAAAQPPEKPKISIYSERHK